MTGSFLACSECHEVVMKSNGVETKVRSKVLLMREESMYAVCKGCDSEIPVPFVFDENIAKSLAENKQEPRLYIKS